MVIFPCLYLTNIVFLTKQGPTHVEQTPTIDNLKINKKHISCHFAYMELCGYLVYYYSYIRYFDGGPVVNSTDCQEIDGTFKNELYLYCLC